jgi:hypothetical protein
VQLANADTGVIVKKALVSQLKKYFGSEWLTGINLYI